MKSSSFTTDFEKLAADLWKLIDDKEFNPYKYKGVADGFLTNIVYNQRKSDQNGNPLWSGPEELADAMMSNEDDHDRYQELAHWIKERAARKAMGDES